LLFFTYMSQRKLITTINRELNYLNEVIDLKVIQGASYKKEAKRHKLLLRMLGEVSRQTRSVPAFSFLSLFL